ncbi:MAG TPA: hypothetical protein VE981_22500 [Planctomycetota bacterium]|nr:hypothetical protein [Planctomycetota bacterium]
MIGVAGPVLAWMLAMLSAAAQESLPRFTQFDFARVRIEHKVLIDATLVNPGSADLNDVRILMSFFEGDRELRKSKPVTLAKVPAGKSLEFKIEAVQLPNFSRYVLLLESGPLKLIYVGDEKAPIPSPRSLPEKLAVESCAEVKPKAFPGDATVKLTVVNLGDLDAREPFAVLSFQDAKAAVVHKVRVSLGPSVKSRCRDAFDVAVPQVPAFASVQAAVGWIAAEFPSPAPLQVEPRDFALGGTRIVRFTDGSVRVAGRARNGLAQDLIQASATFKLGRGEYTIAVPAPLKAGEEKDFEFLVAECPAFDDWAFTLAYGDAVRPGTVTPVPPVLAARRTESKETGADAALGMKPREKDPLEEDPVKSKDPLAAGSATAELKGLFWVEGMTLKNGKYTGDVAFLKVAFRDAKGKPWQPTGVLTGTVYIDGDRRTMTRQFRKESWKVDAKKVDATTVTPDFMALDAATGDLWVGLFRWDKLVPVSRADVNIRIVDVGTWDWKGLEKNCDARAKSPDRK